MATSTENRSVTGDDKPESPSTAKSNGDSSSKIANGGEPVTSSTPDNSRGEGEQKATSNRSHAKEDGKENSTKKNGGSSKKEATETEGTKRKRRRKSGWDDPPSAGQATIGGLLPTPLLQRPGVAAGIPSPALQAQQMALLQQQQMALLVRQAMGPAAGAMTGIATPVTFAPAITPTPGPAQTAGGIGLAPGLYSQGPSAAAAALAASLASQALSKHGQNPALSAADQAKKLLEQATATAQAKAAEKVMANRIYVGSLDYSLQEPTIRSLFAPFGSIVSVDMSFEPSTGRSKGFCFLEYSEPIAAHAAVTCLNGVPLAGRQIKVGRPNNASTGAAASIPPPRPPAGFKRIYVGNVIPAITEAQLQTVFAAFGTIQSCKMIPDPGAPGQHHGYGFIEYAEENVAPEAVKHMNNFELAGQKLQVGPASTPGPADGSNVAVGAAGAGMDPVQQALAAAQQAARAAAGKLNVQPATVAVTKTVPATTTTAANAPSSLTAASSAASQLQAAADGQAQVQSLASEEDVRISALNRQELMMKLARDPAASNPSRVIVLLDMVTPSEIDDDLEEEVDDECSNYGRVEKVKVFVENAGTPGADRVKIFVQFSKVEEAEKAIEKLHRRWFGGKQITAKKYDQVLFDRRDFSQ